MKRFLAILFLVQAAMLSLLAGGVSPSIPWRNPTYTLIARQMPVREAFETFAVSQGLSVVMSAGVMGTFSGDFKEVPSQDFLEQVCTMHNLTWYYDGTALYIYASGEVMTTLVDLAYMKAADVRAMLGELGVEDGRFPIRTASNDELILVWGPPRYVELVMSVIQKADRLKKLRTFNEVETRIFPLKNTWADDVSIGVSAPDGSAEIRGVAGLLQDIMGITREGRVSEKVADKEKQSAENAEAKPQKEQSELDRTWDLMPTVTPVIRADNRLNAVIVRDSATRMPMYENLIKELDKPQQLVEIAVTVLEMNRNDALDWQLSLSLGYKTSNANTAVGQNAANLFDPAALVGNGLAGALTYLGKHVNLGASLTALRQKGRARNISRTSILTMNNIAASMTDTQSYHARVVGQEVATLEEVTAGTKLNIKPRIMYPSSSEEPPRIWLSLELQDGGFEAITVDAMPMTRQSTLETQASVAEADSIILAGYFRDVQEKAGWGIPWLRDLPIIGWLFGGKSWRTETVQRLFILTPYIISLDQKDVARVQAAKHRDITLEETLHKDSKADEEQREERELRIQEQDEIRQEQHKEQMKTLKKEIKERKEKREKERKEQRESERKEASGT
ncbi:MAG: type III secretion system outer membrane ring subunit SctC [Victivallales bacterium]|nr:type III secretion system outer membrane ring subunit SctC [Victivallales bacterium]